MEMLMVLAVMALLVYWLRADQAVSYTCPQCGSRNGDHDQRCSWHGD